MSSKELYPASALESTARRLMAANPMAILTGSLALKMQNIHTRRKPSDIDILMPPGVEFLATVLPGQTLSRPEIAEKTKEAKDEEYVDPSFERTSFLLTGYDDRIKIDVFHAYSADTFAARMHKTILVDGMRINNVVDILSSKISYSLVQDSSVRVKHTLDLMHILSQH